MLRLSPLLLSGLLTAALLLGFSDPSRGDAPFDELPPPESPSEFHAQEWQRISRGLQAEADVTPITSTQADYDALYYHLTVDVRDYAGHIIYGSVLMAGRSLAADLDELILDLCATLIVDSTVFADTARAFTREGHTLTIGLGRIYTVDEQFSGVVYYHGTPCQTNLYPSFGYYNRPVGPNTIPSIATLSEPYGARDWWPSKNLSGDKADSVRVSIIVADTLTATSNGTLESTTPLEPSSLIFTWFEKHPIATYLVSLNATNYAQFTDWYSTLEGGQMPIVHYPYPERLAQAQTSWNMLPEMMDFCADLYGEYPFVDEKYGHTMFNVSGGMEHQCNTSYGRLITNGLHTYDYIVMHELAHQYFGDAVTLETWPDVWLNEGFASYSEALWFEFINGPAAYRSYMTTPSDLGVLDPSGPVHNPTSLFNNNTVYNKGAWILHILRGVLRDDSLFFSLLREYYERHLYGTANTSQFLGDASDVAGFNVTPYLYAYLYRTNRPRFRVSFGSGIVDGALMTVVRVHQTQTDPDTTFQTRLDLALTTPGDTTVSVINSQWRERYYFDFGWAPEALAVDPQDWVLKEVEFQPLPPTVLNTQISSGLVTLPYRDTLVAIGADPPYEWSLIAGQLPHGVTLSENGLLNGVAVDTGEFVFTAQVMNAVGVTDSSTFTLVMNSPLLPPAGLTVYRTDSLGVTLRWQTVQYADSYHVYRATAPDLSDATRIGVTATPKLYDMVDPPGVPGEYVSRFYYVIAVRNLPPTR